MGEPAVQNTLGSVLERLRGGETPGDDPELARKLDRAFGTHVQWLTQQVRRQLRGFGGQDHDDVVQEILETAWRRLPTYRQEGRFRTWMAGIAKNVCRNRRRMKEDALTWDGVVDPESAERSILTTLLDDERDALVRDALAGLDKQERMVADLRYIQELPYLDIQERLSLGDRELKTILMRVKRHLEPALRERIAARGHSISFVQRTD